MKLNYNIVIILFFIFVSSQVYAQRFIPKGIRIGTDLTAIGQTIFSDTRTQFEVNSDIQLLKYLINLDYGIAEFNRQDINYDFHTTGSYFRTGIDLNFINNLPAHNALFLGLRYSRSMFNNELTWQIDHPVYGDGRLKSEEDDLTAQWFEAVAGIKVNVWGNFYLGFTARNKFLKFVQGADSLKPYDIPGFGIAEADNFWSFDYYVLYRLPFKE